MRARPQPAHHTRALAEGRAPGNRALDAREGRRRRLLPEARAEGSAGLRGDLPDRVPVGPPRRRDLPDGDRRGRLGRPDGNDHLPPMARAPRGRGPPRRAPARPRSAAGHGLRRRRARGRRGAGAAGRPRLRRLPEDLRGSRGPHLRADRAALDVHGRPPRRHRLRARARDGACRARSRRTGGRRSAASGSSWTTTRTPATARSRRPTASARSRARPCRRRSPGTSWPRWRPRTSRWRRCPRRFAELGDRHAAIDDVAHSLEPLLEMYERDEAEGEGDMPYPPDYPKMPGEPKRVQPSRDRDRKRSAPGYDCGSFFAPRFVTGRGRRRHDRPDVAVRRLVQVHDHRRVVARPACPCAPAGRSTRP